MTGFENLRQFLNQTGVEWEPMVPWLSAFSRAWRRLHVFASSSDWFIVLFRSVVIGQSNYFGLVLRLHTELKTSNGRSVK